MNKYSATLVAESSTGEDEVWRVAINSGRYIVRRTPNDLSVFRISGSDMWQVSEQERDHILVVFHSLTD